MQCAPRFVAVGIRAQGWFAAILLAVLISGCRPEEEKTDPAGTGSGAVAAPSPVSAPLNVLVIDSPETGPVISRHYKARTNSSVTILDATWDEVVEQDFAPLDKADLVIYPTLRTGELVSRKLLRELETSQFADASAWRGMTGFDRDRFSGWKGKVIGISLGQTIPVMLVRNDVLQKTGLPVPATWQEFSALCAAAGKLNPEDGVPTALEIPLDGHSASSMLAARAAASVVVPGRYSTWFDVKDMRPLIGDEPFRQALAGWVQDMALSADRQIRTPKQVLNRFLRGELAVAVTTIHSRMLEESLATPTFEFTISATPGNDQVFDPESKSWTKHQDLKPCSVPFAGCEGMMAGITSETRRSRISMDFLSWLLDKQISAIVAVENASLGPSRKAHIAAPDKWLGSAFSADNVAQYSRVLQDWDERRVGMTVLRIPGADRYLDVLDQAVRDALLHGKDIGAALGETASQWEKLSEELGKDSQRRMYSASEGVSW